MIQKAVKESTSLIKYRPVGVARLVFEKAVRAGKYPSMEIV
jgi:hypothetical protein